MLDVGQNQFLVLLFVVQPDLHNSHDVNRRFIVITQKSSRCSSTYCRYARISPWPGRDKTPRRRAWKLPSDGIVIRIEQLLVAWGRMVDIRQVLRAETFQRTKLCVPDASVLG